MKIKILGSAAGGGFPQWNCACANCAGLRAGTLRSKARMQAQVAISADSKTWFLLGASPDLRGQIESAAELQPRDGVRQSPIAGVVLLNADVDHVFGLLLMRESQLLCAYTTGSVRRIVSEDNSMFAMMQRAPRQLRWNEFKPCEAFSLFDPAGKDSGLRCRAISLGAHFPAYVSQSRRAQLDPQEASLGIIVESASGKRFAYMPAVPCIDDALLNELDSAEVLLFDGTFWSDDELIRIQGSGQTARQMGHVPVLSPEGSPSEGSLSKLAKLRCPRKIYVHINNTNPMLNEAGDEYRQARAAGWEIAEDGWQFEL
ncbi:MAG: pyrroloquinoline quinone biosynthesis protein PqqB [Candidatus Sulfotelmatobacter sp.]